MNKEGDEGNTLQNSDQIEVGKGGDLAALYANPKKEGFLNVLPKKASKKTEWRKKWLLLKDDYLYLFEKKYDANEEVKKGPSIVVLADATLTPATEGGKSGMLLKTPLKSWVLAGDTPQELAPWTEVLNSTISVAAAAAKSVSLNPQQEKALAQAIEMVRKPEGWSVEKQKNTIIRFLFANNFDVEKAVRFYDCDVIWRKQMGLNKLTIANVYPQLKGRKIFLPGTKDKKGRPILVARASQHNPDSDFLDTLMPALYLFELGLAGNPNSEITIIYDLKDFEKKNSDNRTLKFLLDVFQQHYPGKVGSVYVLSCPWFYRILWKVVKPWLTGDLLSKVNMLSGPEELPEYVSKDQTLVEHGGTFKYDHEAWLKDRAAKEGVSLSAPEAGKYPIDPLMKPLIEEVSVEASSKDAKKVGWTKKQGGIIKNYNKRYCTAKGRVFYYYLGNKDKRPEGYIPLWHATVLEGKKGDKDTIFHVITATGKDCIFEAENVQTCHDWVKALKSLVDEANKADE